MKGIKGKWYITIFAAVMGFAAGVATELNCGYVNDILESMGMVEGIDLLTLSLTGMLLNGAFFCWSSILEGKIGKVMALGALWVKAILLGLFCRELTMDFNTVKAVIILLTVFGGGCICASFLMDRDEKNDKAKRLAVWLSGMAVEGIIIPSVARTCALMFN